MSTFLVFIGRMGNTKQALQLITNELGDVNQAIAFCKEHNEHELWEDLISYSIDKPSEYWSTAVVVDVFSGIMNMPMAGFVLNIFQILNSHFSMFITVFLYRLSGVGH